jgi:glycosyltransferase involved in cell wall biosynthesis
MADAVVAPSKAFLDDCLAVFPHIAAKSHVIHNGVDLGELAQADEMLTTSAWRPYLLCIAAHNEKKALEVLLQTFARLTTRWPTLRLVLVGDGPLRAQHEALARTLDIDDRVVFLGSRGRREVARLLHDCRAFVLPSRAEPFGIVVIEALGSCRPVVATAVGGIPEIIEHERTGLLVAPDDPEALAGALERVLTDDGLGESLARAGYQRVRAAFDCGAMAARYIDLYTGLLDVSHSG